MAPNKKVRANREAAAREAIKLLANAQASERMFHEESKQITKQVVSTPKRGANGQPSRVKPKDTKGSKHGEKVTLKRLERQQAPVLNARLADYFRQLEDPWKYQGVKCPINYNPVPSFMVTTAHTTYTNNSFTVPIGLQRQLTLFPGHAPPSDGDAMDGPSYHCYGYTVNATSCSVGPVNTTSGVTGIIGFTSPDTGMALTADVTSTAAPNFTPLTPDVLLPYTALISTGGHTRWKLVSMGVVISNTTPIQYRGGQIVHVQPNSNIVPTGNMLADYASQPSFRITQEPNLGAYKISWIPRADDLAYWHTEGSAYGNSPWNAGINIWFQGCSGIAQTYSFEVVCNWELSGHSLAAVSAATIHQPADKNLVEPTLSVLNFTKSSASGALEAATTVAQHMAPLVEKGVSLVRSPAGKAIASLFGV